MRYIAKRYDTGAAVAVYADNGVITKTEPISNEENLPLIGPGLFDIQINGGLGVEFSSPDLTVESVRKVCDKVLKEGVFRFFPTITTNAPDVLRHAVDVIVETIHNYPQYKDQIAGIHLEGPFISRSDGSRGAHPLVHCREYDEDLLEDLVNRGQGMIRVLTLSPEYNGAEEFIAKAVSRGLLVSLGHTNSTPVQIAGAVAAGAKLSTHLGNGTSHLLDKAGNYCFAQLTDDRLRASIICDGFHLTPMMLRIFARTKGFDNLILISDQASVSGLGPGKYSTQLCNLEITEKNKVVLSGDRHLLAGAWHSLTRGIANMTAISEKPLNQVYDLAVKNPARLFGEKLFSNSNDDFLAIGVPADFLIFRLKPSTFGPLGIADSANFIPGDFDFEAVVYHGNTTL